MIYVAMPFTHPQASVRMYRYEMFLIFTAWMTNQGKFVISPMEKVPMALYAKEFGVNGIGIDWRYWGAFSKDLLARCDEVVTLNLEGYRLSEGLTAELELAAKFDKKITQHSLAWLLDNVPGFMNYEAWNAKPA